MPSRKKHTNPFLLLIAIALCLVLGVTLRQSTADFSILEETSSSMTASSDSQKQDKTDSDQKENSAPSATASPTPAKKPSDSKRKVSDEAASGVWTSSGSNWLFMVDGKAHTGWLTDTDGKTYYFNQDGIMQTGWVDADGKRYYMDLDGIMQTGIITVDGKSYELQSDGSLKGYSPKESTPTSKPESDSSNSKENNKKDSDKKNSGKKDSGKKDSKSQKPSVKYAALTFDDGPSSFTDRLLDCLESNNAKATFFMVGKEIDSFPDEVKRMEALGCELGNHTYSHADLTTLSPKDMSAEIAGVDESLVNLVGHGATVLRPPYGSINDSVRSTVGTPMILWSIDTLDWETQDAQKTVDTVMSQVQDGSIILMHDIFSTSVDAAEIFIPKLIEEGYQLVTIHELAKIKGTELQTGIAYGDFTG